jgi:hypothetical protein
LTIQQEEGTPLQHLHKRLRRQKELERFVWRLSLVGCVVTLLVTCVMPERSNAEVHLNGSSERQACRPSAKVSRSLKKDISKGQKAGTSDAQADGGQCPSHQKARMSWDY